MSSKVLMDFKLSNFLIIKLQVSLIFIVNFINSSIDYLIHFTHFLIILAIKHFIIFAIIPCFKECPIIIKSTFNK